MGTDQRVTTKNTEHTKAKKRRQGESPFAGFSVYFVVTFLLIELCIQSFFHYDLHRC